MGVDTVTAMGVTVMAVMVGTAATVITHTAKVTDMTTYLIQKYENNYI